MRPCIVFVALLCGWSLGGLLRVTAYHLYGVDDDIGLLSPALLLTHH